MLKSIQGLPAPDNAPTVTLSVTPPATPEGNTLTATISRSGGDLNLLSQVRFYTVPLTANESDYQVYGGELITFSPGQSSITRTVEMYTDSEVEGVELLKVMIANPRLCNLGVFSHTVSILDTTIVVPVTVAAITAASGVEGTELSHVVTLSGATGGTFAFALTGITATAGSDFLNSITATNGVEIALDSLVVPIGVTTFAVNVPTVQNGVVESSETYTLTIGGVSAIGTILDDDTAATIGSISNPGVTEGADLIFAVALNKTTTQQETYTFSLGGTASSSVDYLEGLSFTNGVTLEDDTLIVPVGVSAFTVTIATTNDALVEPTETLALTIGGITGTGTILDNDVSEVALQALANIEILEAPYGVLNTSQRSATTTGGGYVMLAVGREQPQALSFAVYASDTEEGVYSKVLDNQVFTPHCDLTGVISYAHETLSFTNSIDFPGQFTANTLALIADTAGQKEFATIGGYNSITVLGDTSTLFYGVSPGVYDSLPIQVSAEDTARLYVLNTFAIDPAFRANGAQVFYKVVPKDVFGAELDISEVAPITITIQSIARAPYGPRDIGFYSSLESNSSVIPVSDYFRFPSIDFPRYNLHMIMGASSRQELTLSSFFNPGLTAESGVAYKVDIYGNDNTVVRTKTATMTVVDGKERYFINYTFNEQGADTFKDFTKYVFYAEKGGIRSKEQTYLIESYVRDVGLVSAISGVVSGGDIVYTFTVQNRTAPYGIDLELSGTVVTGQHNGTPTFSSGASLLGQNAIQVEAGVSSFTMTVPLTGDAQGKTLTVKAGEIAYPSETITSSVTVPATTMVVSSVSSPTVTEGGTLTFTVTLSGTTVSSQNFAFSTGGGATGGTDYVTPLTPNNGVTISGGNFVAPSGVSSFNVSTLTTDDLVVAGNKTLTLTVGGVTGTGTIVDNDSPFLPIFNSLSLAMSTATGETQGSLPQEVIYTYGAQYQDLYFDIHPPTAETTKPVILGEIAVGAIIRIEYLIRGDVNPGISPFVFKSAQNGFSKVGLTHLTNTTTFNLSATEYGTTRSVIRYQNNTGAAIPVSERLSFYLRNNGATVPANCAVKDFTIAIE